MLVGREQGGRRTSGDVEVDGPLVGCAPLQRRRVWLSRVRGGLQRAPHRLDHPGQPVVGVVDGAVGRAAHKVAEQRAKGRVDRAAGLEQRVTVGVATEDDLTRTRERGGGVGGAGAGDELNNNEKRRVGEGGLVSWNRDHRRWAGRRGPGVRLASERHMSDKSRLTCVSAFCSKGHLNIHVGLAIGQIHFSTALRISAPAVGAPASSSTPELAMPARKSRRSFWGGNSSAAAIHLLPFRRPVFCRRGVMGCHT